MFFGPLILPARAIRAMPRQRGWTYAPQEVIEGPPKAQFIAPDAATLTLSLFLHVEFCNPKQVIDALVAMADAHEAHVLQDESGLVHGQYVVESVNDDPRWTLPDGTVLAATVDVTLSDPGLDELLAIARPKPIATEDTAADTKAEPAPEDRSRAPDDVSPAEIARL